MTGHTTRSIRLRAENLDVLSELLDRVNQKASEHVFTPNALLKLAQDAEHRLDDIGLPTGVRRGAFFCAHSGASLPKAYGHQRVVNVAALLRGVRDWSLVNLTKEMAWPNGRLVSPCQMGVRLTEAQDVIAVDVLRKRYHVVRLGTAS